MQSPYVRPNLVQTRANKLGWAELLTTWLGDLKEILEGPLAGMEAEQAFLLIAITGQLERIQSGFVEKAGGQRTLAEAKQKLAEGKSGLVALALSQVDLMAWSKAAKNLHEDYRQRDADEDMAKRARALFVQLDNSELVWAYAQQVDLAPPELRHKLDEAVCLLVKCEEAFWGASLFVQSAGYMMRPDLARADRNLGDTARKFDYLLDFLEETQAEYEALPTNEELVAWIRKRRPKSG